METVSIPFSDALFLLDVHGMEERLNVRNFPSSILEHELCEDVFVSVMAHATIRECLVLHARRYLLHEFQPWLLAP